MKLTKLARKLGAIDASGDFKELLGMQGHIQLSPFGEIGFAEYEQFGVVSPCIAEVFSLVVAPVGSPALAVADFASFEALGWRSGSGWNSVGVVSVFNLESSGVQAPERRPRHDERYHEV